MVTYISNNYIKPGWGEWGTTQGPKSQGRKNGVEMEVMCKGAQGRSSTSSLTHLNGPPSLSGGGGATKKMMDGGDVTQCALPTSPLGRKIMIKMVGDTNTFLSLDAKMPSYGSV